MWSEYTAYELWADDHISKSMLAFHLDPESEPASRPHVFLDRSAAWISEKFDFQAGGKVLDFGCGPGLYTTRFHDAGAKVTGIDYSHRSIGYALNKAEVSGRNISYIEGNYLDAELPGVGSYDLATMIYCDFCPLSPAQRKTLLHRIGRILKPGGNFLFDVFTNGAYDSRIESSSIEANLMSGFWSPDKYTGIQQTWKYDDERVILDKYDIFEKDRTLTIYNWLQYFSSGALEEELRSNGFIIKEIYSDVSGAPWREDSATMAVVAEKKE